MNQQKIKVIGLKDDKLSQKEKMRKEKIFTSSVRIEDLKKKEVEGNYQLDLDQIKMELYD